MHVPATKPTSIPIPIPVVILPKSNDPKAAPTDRPITIPKAI